MSTISPPEAPTAAPAEEPKPEEPGAAAAAAPAAAAPRSVLGYWIGGVSLVVVAVLSLGFLLAFTVVGRVGEARAQRIAYATFRYELAASTAPIGPLDYQGKPLAGGTPVAVLSIPELGIYQVVGEGTSSEVLMKGPGHERDSVMPGQVGTCVIIGRRSAYGGPFHYLNQLQAGDTFTVITGQGTSTYRVSGLRPDGAPGAAVLSAGQGRLTLVTARGPAFEPRGLLYVDADLISKAYAPPGTLPAISAAEKPGAGDGGATIPLVFWLQGLVVASLAILWARFGWKWRTAQVWVVGVPVLTALGLGVADTVARLLPNVF